MVDGHEQETAAVLLAVARTRHVALAVTDSPRGAHRVAAPALDTVLHPSVLVACHPKRVNIVTLLSFLSESSDASNV